MKRGIFCNLSWLLLGSVVVKLLGGVYRLVLTRVLGTSIGLYQMVFAVYSFLVILISSGIPLAISKQISSQANLQDRQKIVYGAVSILFSVSAILAFVLIMGCKGIAIIQGDVKVCWCYVVLAPSLMFSAGSAILRGYCQGVYKFNISALSGIVEQLARVVLGLVLMIVLNRFYLFGALLGAMLGTLMGDIVSFVFLKLALRNKIDIKYSFRYLDDGKRVLKYAYPIMLYSIIIPLTNFIDSFLVVRLLGVSMPYKSSILLYGLQSGVVSAIISIPSIFSFSLASVLMPNLSGDYAVKDNGKFNQKVSLAFKLILFVSLPCAIYFAINASNIVEMLYGGGLNGFGINGQYVTKNLLIISSIGVVFSGINQLSAVVLQNLNEKIQPIINLSIGVVCKLVIELIFVPSKLGVYAYSVAIVVCFVVSGVLNLYSVEKYCHNIFDFNYLTKQFILCAVVFGVLTVFKLFNSSVVFVLGSIFTIMIYLIGIYLIKLFSKKEIKQLFK